MSYENLLAEARAMAAEFAEIRRYIHAHAEVGFDMPLTLAKVREALVSYGYEPKNAGKAGLVATVGGENGGPCILLRADMDALPMKEEADVPFAAENGNMHACGHDMHTTMLLCAAKLLKMHESELCGRVFLMFQPAEELLSGAKDMVEAGVLAEAGADAALMLHVFAGSGMGAGKLIVPPSGVSAPAADYFTINVKGKSSHGAMPQKGKDALLAACEIVTALQGVCAREVPAGEPAMLTIGQILAGTAPNIIAGEAKASGTMRAFAAESRENLKNRLQATVNGVATVYGVEANVVFDKGCPALVNDGDMCERAQRYCKALLGEGAVLPASALGGAGGSEDFAYIAERVPAVCLLLSAEANEYPLHHSKVVFDESTIPVGGAIYAYTAMRWLGEHE